MTTSITSSPYHNISQLPQSMSPQSVQTLIFLILAILRLILLLQLVVIILNQLGINIFLERGLLHGIVLCRSRSNFFELLDLVIDLGYAESHDIFIGS